MDLVLRAALVTFALGSRGGTLESAWEAVDRAAAEVGPVIDEESLRRAMESIRSLVDL